MSVIQEEGVFCFKCVLLYFKQYNEQYCHFNVSYIEGRKTIFSFKMVPKADAAYLEFQSHICRYSNPKSTVHIFR